MSASCSPNWPDRGKRPAGPRCVRHGVARAGGPKGLGASRSWSSSTGCWSPWSICATSCRTRSSPSSSPWTAPPSPRPSVRSVRFSAARGFAVPDRAGLRLKTLADVFAYAEAEGVELRMDGAETQVRRPQAGRPGRRAFVSGKKKQNTVKTTTFSDGQGRMLLSGAVRPGPHARSDRPAHRGHRRAVPDPSHGQGPGRLRLPGAGQGVPRPGQRPAEETRRRGVRRRHARLAARPAPPVLGPDLRRAHQRRATSSGRPCAGSPDAATPTPRPISRSPDWSPTAPPSGPPADRRAPNWSSSATPPADHPPAEPPGQHARISISPKVVRF